ncbi:uroporphyrinogen-III synthase [Arenimonas caeni]|jgi:uroporphyrinogen-III synthase|uniref:uroporphyrinogen-III synthase n=1 Tax=Arenimonas caeni TaxID=2058085 RepID=UPI002A369F5F|nr:uroporphyrinogen-III synthase [Arenimonas caeni]MDY0021863.1 uroporphyrinogen-III synthase [Arenimonas caeni]
MDKSSSTPALAGWYVISLRPSGSHAPVRRAASGRGARVLSISTLALRPQPSLPALQVALACPLVVVTSPAAVQFARRQLPLSAAPGQRWLALGAGTAAALERVGVPGAIFPAEGTDSEALLALPELKPPPSAVGLVTAPGGRGLIAETLAQRGAQIHRANVYRRIAVHPSAARLRRLRTLPRESALLVSSTEAFDGLWQRLDETGREALRGRAAVASSPRLAAHLAELGFRMIVLAPGAAPDTLLDALAADVARGRFR